MELLILGGYLAFFCFGFLLGTPKCHDTAMPPLAASQQPEQEQLDRQWKALFDYNPMNPKEEFDEQ